MLIGVIYLKYTSSNGLLSLRQASSVSLSLITYFCCWQDNLRVYQDGHVTIKSVTMKDCHLCVKCVHSTHLVQVSLNPRHPHSSAFVHTKMERKAWSVYHVRDVNIYLQYYILCRQRWEGSRQAWGLSGSVGAKNLLRIVQETTA